MGLVMLTKVSIHSRYAGWLGYGVPLCGGMSSVRERCAEWILTSVRMTKMVIA